MNKFKMLFSLAIFSVLLSVFMLSGCGLKKWPEPQKREDSFAWGEIDAARRDNCLFIDINVSGAIENLDYLLVQLEPVGDKFGEGCPGCPFKAKQSVRFTRTSSGMKLVGSNVRLAVCGLKAEEVYRWKVVGYNVYKTYRPVQSAVYRPEE